MSTRRCFVVVNPIAGGGRTGRLWPRLEQRVRTALGSFEHGITTAPGHATALARAALLAGYDLIVAVGGDGTFGEVATGFFEGQKPLAPAAELALLPTGTGSDLPRSFGMVAGVDDCCARLASDGMRLIDVGQVAFTDHQGGPAERVFLNVTSFGCGGAVAASVAHMDKRLGGKLTFLIATSRVLAGYRDQFIEVAIDDGAVERLSVTNYAVCNARYFGGGIKVAPDAEPDEGFFDVTVWAGYGLRDFLLRQRRLYDGRHVEDPRTRRLRGRSVWASSNDRVLLDIDGENPGTLPVRIDLLPTALRLKIGASSTADGA